MTDFNQIQKILSEKYPYPVFLLSPYISPTPYFTEQECTTLIDYCKTLVFDYQKNGMDKVVTELINAKCAVSSITNQSLYERLRKLIIDVNQSCWSFHLYDFGEPLKFMEYSEEYNGFFGIHTDFNPETITKFRKLTVVIQLTDEDCYEGGDLIIQCYEKEVVASRKKGTVIIFPSFLLHRITPVIKGVRHSMVSFVYGPPFR